MPNNARIIGLYSTPSTKYEKLQEKNDNNSWFCNPLNTYLSRIVMAASFRKIATGLCKTVTQVAVGKSLQKWIKVYKKSTRYTCLDVRNVMTNNVPTTYLYCKKQRVVRRWKAINKGWDLCVMVIRLYTLRRRWAQSGSRRRYCREPRSRNRKAEYF